MEVDKAFLDVIKENAQAQQQVADETRALVGKMDDFIDASNNGREKQTVYLEKVITQQNYTLFLRVRNTTGVLVGVVTTIFAALKFWKA